MPENNTLSLPEMRKVLRQKISRYFNLEDLKTLTHDLNIEEENLAGTTKEAKIRSLIDHYDRHNNLQDLLNALKEARPRVKWPELPINNNGSEELVSPSTLAPSQILDEDAFPFTNRDDEINRIMSSYPPYRIVEAPMGYGKTWLLKKLAGLFDEENWCCEYVAVQESIPLNPIVNRLQDKVMSDPSTKRGIVLLIDLDERTSNSLLENLARQIAQIQRALRERIYFANKKDFRVVLAGRSLSGAIPQLEQKFGLRLPILKLSPFDYNVIRRSAENHLSNLTNRSLMELAAHLLFLTGGHPGCMVKIIKMFEESPNYAVADFFQEYKQQILDEIVCPTVDSIRGELLTTIKNASVRQFIDTNVFRYTYYPILEQIIHVYQLPDINDAIDFADMLTTSQLFDRNKNTAFLHDGVLRRLAAVRLWYQEPDNFVSYCQQAQEIYIEYLKDNKCQMPSRWATEYLFAGIQQHAPNIDDPDRRRELHELFFSEIVPTALKHLEKGRKKRELQQELKYLLRNDWEFEYTVNFYLRREDSRYDDNPFQELLSRISKW